MLMVFRCPGSEGARRPEIVFVKCQSCGEEVEMFSDEQATKCSCGAVVCREKAPSCVDWCKYVKECVKVRA